MSSDATTVFDLRPYYPALVLIRPPGVGANAPPSNGWGSGFFAGPQLVLTCRHNLVDPGSNALYSTVGVCVFDGRDWKDYRSAIVNPLFLDGNLDVAALIVPGIAPMAVPLSLDLRREDDIRVVGFLPEDYGTGFKPVAVPCFIPNRSPADYVPTVNGKWEKSLRLNYTDASLWEGTWVCAGFSGGPCMDIARGSNRAVAIEKAVMEAKGGLPYVLSTPLEWTEPVLHRLPAAHVPNLNALPPIPASYLEWLRNQCADIELLGLQLKKGTGATLSNIYVPLTTHSAGAGKNVSGGGGEAEEPELILDWLDRESLYVSGGAGSGKSTFCRWAAWLCAAGKMPEPDVLPPEGYEERFPESFRGRLPVLIRLREFWTALPRTPTRDMTAAELEDTMSAWIRKRHPELDWLPHLQRGNLLLLLDGVDEVPEKDGASFPRALLISALSAAIPLWCAVGNRLLLTSRPYGLTDPEVWRLRLRRAPIADLTSTAQHLLIARWFRVLGDAGAAAGMIRNLDGNEAALPLAASAMFLTVMCVLYDEGKELPQDQYELYKRVLENVLVHRFPYGPEREQVEARLEVIAHGMHSGEGLREEWTAPSAQATLREIDLMLTAYKNVSSHTDDTFRDIVDIRDTLLSHSGLLVPRSQSHAEFIHLSFQEFLAARRVLALDEERRIEIFDAFMKYAETPEWRNTLGFVFSSLSQARSATLLGRLIENVHPGTPGLHVLTASCVAIFRGKKLDLKDDALKQKFRQDCLDAIEREVPAQERAVIGLALGRIDDPRIVTDLRDPARQPDAFVLVPAGPYFIGEQKRKKRLPEPFLIARYTTTNSQYGVFIEDGGYARQDLWSSSGWSWRESNGITEPRFWRHPKWNAPNLPVVGVSFWEAEAFCNWAGGRLPSELEWESAARGPEGFVYPWGDGWSDGICNTRESGLGKTSPVGLFPQSRSRPYGLEDMAGNVWEWCSGKRNEIVWRGGAWVDVAGVARAADRGRNGPEVRYEDQGFRVVRDGSRTP